MNSSITFRPVDSLMISWYVFLTYGEFRLCIDFVAWLFDGLTFFAWVDSFFKVDGDLDLN
jgi:hypothetical protein